jgi:hypothetical protein
MIDWFLENWYSYSWNHRAFVLLVVYLVIRFFVTAYIRRRPKDVVLEIRRNSNDDAFDSTFSDDEATGILDVFDLDPQPEPKPKPKPVISDPGKEWHDVLKNELERLTIGRIAFNPPDSMQVGIAERMEARIATNLKTDLVASLKGCGFPQVWDIRISELMKVRLSGDQFKILALNEESQIIDSDDYDLPLRLAS